ncbi:hypothetical protein A3D81_01660 [Candidatus Curtissbacteria bacterium RIFCSPHIGHO2_02_FULL_40_17]|uniref:FCP1 homology domain-containing protein n=4 Tax=Candidatus Curtissiibacteriota TaxID=1752717 RepID=A0A1F5GH34_9BACT|nr:MAG: hypothetical protein A2693_03420 [Candidatus Curtissbacteria bacterium RIFCSPHIGHO2_01_FULL_40_12]OGD91164.1 MAG: hypothetical protein A3D81_01660 [Candidatus Curtissbacteria bacterium RIFCSPHIGHO2_02_FULL_40_17]OGE05468.1 MAG: hypothetical protein A3F45_03755 [Candidatus Curtissbacteria bacterium RIFCSPHIGHO2_12_FULL_41_17]OGE07130.1 MAG: hypothetical protein A3I53_02945 [Candidatus Curtissbacteria bacterium RIFCSPLOWO2_02_FULL_40_13b]
MKALRENIYLDIDGVILTRGVLPAQHLDKFLKYILGNYSVFWLTSRYHGETKKIIGYLSQFLTPEIISLLGQIKPTSFDLDKTEGIDFNRNFFWLDNELFDSEKNTLRIHNVYDSWIELDLIQNPNQLLYLINSKLNLRK